MTSRMLTTLAALTLVVAACGDGDGNGADDGDTTAPTEAPEFEAGSTMAALQDAGVLRVGIKIDQPLFGVQTPAGDVIGFDAEIAKLIAEGLFGQGGADNIEFQEAISANREPFLQQGTVDMVIATYTINDARKELVGFAGPYLIDGQGIMVAAGNPESIGGVDDLNGKIVCSVDGSTSISNLREMAPDTQDVIALDTYSACAEELLQGRVHAVTTDEAILVGLVQDNPDELELAGETFTDEPYGIGVQHEAVDFREWINDRLDEIYASGEWAAAYERTIGEVTGEVPEPPPVERY